MERITVGILAHVDAGKTTLSEGMLYLSGSLRRLGRVDHGDAFLDTQALERQRGITIFSKQALLPLKTKSITLLDTPGHVDFSAEMERTLQVLDYAILVISGTDGVQSHTETLWRLLRAHHIPTLLFVNKMDLAGTDRAALLTRLRVAFGDGVVDLSDPAGADLAEQAALCSETLMEKYLSGGLLTARDLAEGIRSCSLFPCWFGSALKLTGVAEFLDGLEEYTLAPRYPGVFGARVFKITRDEQGKRLTWLKITGGGLKAKTLLSGTSGGEAWSEKADQLRLYSGTKYTVAEALEPGQVAAVTGLRLTFAGQGFGFEATAAEPTLIPVLNYRVLLPQGADAHTALQQFRQLEEEDPQLHVLWEESAGLIHVQLMGEIQKDILKSLVRERFGLEIGFDPGTILYKETIRNTVEGVGHYEPLRHYAECHLILEPLPRGSGLQFAARVSEDELDRNWQRLILTHLQEKTHRGVLTGAPITDLRITLAAGRAHLKHTEGGDFRQATYRAVRQGLMQAESVLLEPLYAFRLEVPAESVGRAMSDIQRMAGSVAAPEQTGGTAILTGTAPVALMQDYAMEVAAYTRGRGRLSLTVAGYAECHNAPEVIAAAAYIPEADLDNTPDSVFCAHGAGFSVAWDRVPEYMHLEAVLQPPKPDTPEPPPRPTRSSAGYSGTLAEDKELQAIFEREFGPVKRRQFLSGATVKAVEQNRDVPGWADARDYLLVDGYNIIFAWPELNELSRDNLDMARRRLADMLCNYQAMKKITVILVFDAYRVAGSPGSVEKYGSIHIVYTKEAQTADSYIEKTTYEIGKSRRVQVATSDGAEQMIILGNGALRISARMFYQEVQQALKELDGLLRDPRSGKSGANG